MVFSKIKEITAYKKAKKIEPSFVVLMELREVCNISLAEIKKECHKLVVDRKVKFGETLNDYYFYENS